MSHRLLLYSRDPGGANTLLPLVEPLRGQGFEVLLHGRDFALDIFRQHNFVITDVAATTPGQWTADAAKRFLQAQKPDFLLTGTSADDFTEKLLWDAARELKIPSAAILDNWVNYGLRFSPYTITQLAQYQNSPHHCYQPDRIFVMDEIAKKDMLAIGFSEERVVITGQPYFQWIREQYNLLSKQTPADLKIKAGAEGNAYVIGFASQPVEALCPGQGYTEFSVLEELSKALQAHSAILPDNVCVVVRAHPREDKKRLEAFLKNLQHAAIPVILDQSPDPSHFVMACNLVLGMSSMLLLEAMLAGKPVMSVQPGLVGDDPLVLGRLGYVQTVRTTAELQTLLGAYFTNPAGADGGRGSFPWIENPVERVMDQLGHALHEKPRSI